MTGSLNPSALDWSRSLDPLTLRILSMVNHVAVELEIPYILGQWPLIPFSLMSSGFR
jgi:hypothetical protein